MAESDFQRGPLMYAVEALRIHFQDRSDVYVSGNLFIYYEQGNPQAVVAPDVFAVFGASKQDRMTYRLWEEPTAPQWVIEITSRSTRGEDQRTKRALYAQLGVQEYWQYDPTGDYLDPQLQGFRLEGGSYEPITDELLPDGVRALYSEVLGLDIRLEGGRMYFYDVERGEKLLTHEEAEQERRMGEERIRQEAEARQAAEAQLAEEAEARQAAEAQLAELAARLRALEERGTE
ncbi:Uma2 family endonuclease [Candidatus Entotheonella palauensis]|nr:Uma2 family endonuclease [Candidatus Entotheonella palauensis]